LPWETPAEPAAQAPVAETPAESFAVEASAASAEAADDVSAWLGSLDEQRPVASSVTAETEELPDWLKDLSADEEVPTPVPVSDWVPAGELPVSQEVASETAAQAESVMEVEAAPQPPLRLRSTDSLQDKDASFIRTARELLNKGSLDQAMASYAKLIKKGKLLEEVIEDLNEIVYRHPVDVIVWQTMGDAYMRSNRLQEALDSYTKAEELLRR
jgi:tetratricopeptide (TPR) repeat protein